MGAYVAPYVHIFIHSLTHSWGAHRLCDSALDKGHEGAPVDTWVQLPRLRTTAAHSGPTPPSGWLSDQWTCLPASSP